MSLDATQVRLGQTGHIYKADEGTAMPTDVSPLPADWFELGYTETLPSMNVDTSKQQFTPAQSLVPVRESITGQMVTAAFTLWQRNATTLKTVFNGGTIVEGATPDIRIYRPPSVPVLLVGAYIIEIIDGEIIDRYCIERASTALTGEVPFSKENVTGYPLELTYLQPAGGGSPWSLVSNDPAIEVDA